MTGTARAQKTRTNNITGKEERKKKKKTERKKTLKEHKEDRSRDG